MQHDSYFSIKYTRLLQFSDGMLRLLQVGAGDPEMEQKTTAVSNRKTG
jgi:hypothetical protein